ncbi:GspH/FimT family pseudopilin [Stenotrophomonas sp.]|uniref:type II secretion system protein XpsH n=1 Tax=Stenotrophomonas sp. TaxID=69392 RepID=UPI0028A89B74|nr:GspH/FimT family pseudopilin [Stenotrophomonas sp.]
MPRRHAMRGVSLLEMLLVVALIAIIGLITATAMNGGIDGMRLRSAGKEVASQLRYTRTQAIATGERQRFLIDPRARTWQGANGRHGSLPGSLDVRFHGAGQVANAPGQGGIAFHPDGGSSGGTIELSVRDALWRIDVGWVTGEVRSGPVRGAP